MKLERQLFSCFSFTCVISTNQYTNTNNNSTSYCYFLKCGVFLCVCVYFILFFKIVRERERERNQMWHDIEMAQIIFIFFLVGKKKKTSVQWEKKTRKSNE